MRGQLALAMLLYLNKNNQFLSVASGLLLERIAKLHSGQPILLSIGVNPLYLRFRGAGDFVQTRQVLNGL